MQVQEVCQVDSTCHIERVWALTREQALSTQLGETATWVQKGYLGAYPGYYGITKRTHREINHSHTAWVITMFYQYLSKCFSSQHSRIFLH